MFDIRFTGDGTAIDTPPPVAIVGSHQREDRFPVGIAFVRDELGSLPDVLRRLWPEVGVPDGLVAHVVREARESDLIGGETPQTYSPLGDLRPGAVGRWIADDRLADAHPAAGSLTAQVRLGPLTAAGSQVIEFIVGDEVVSALVFSPDAVVVPVPANADSVELIDRPDFRDDVTDLLTISVPGATIDELVLWRLYTGDNSLVRDFVGQAVDGIHRLSLRAVDRVGVLVGRTVRVAARVLNSDLGDPFAPRRLRMAEMRQRHVADSCPRLDDVFEQEREAVVVVHGTMSTGLALAAAVRASTTRPPAIVRFEHDTWLPIHHNAKDLADLVEQHVTGHVLFVAHSRGGLVARNAAEILRVRQPGRTVEMLTLGSPFLGTPIADVGSLGFRGVQALMGGLRWADFPVVETLTRLAGLALKSHPPRGITDMSPDAGYLAGFTIHPPTATRTFAGKTDDTGADSYGLAALHGFSAGMMHEVPSDLVVPTDSAAGGVTDSITLECDHFSYLCEPKVRESIDEFIAHLHAVRALIRRRRLRANARHTPLSR